MNYQTKANPSIRDSGINSFSLHKYFIRSGVKKLNAQKEEKKTFVAQTLFQYKVTSGTTNFSFFQSS